MTWLKHPVVAAAVWLSLVPLGALLAGHDVLTAALPLLLACATVGSLLSVARLPRLVVFLGQGVAVVAVLTLTGLSLAGPGSAVAALTKLTASGVEAIRIGASPLEITPGVVWLCLLLTAVLLLMVQLLADALEQPAFSIVPLALVFGIAALILPGELPWLFSLPVTLAYLLILLVGTRTGRDAAGGLARRLGFQASRLAVAGAAGLVAAALALATAAVVPVGSTRSWDETGNDGPIQLTDPTLDLNENLRRPVDAHILTYRASDEGPTYLRTVALTQLSSDGASLVPMNLSRFGLGSAARQPGSELSVDVEMAVPSEYLPAPFAPRSISADGTWTFDPETLTIVASGPDRAQQSVGLSYRVSSVVPDASRAEIAGASAGSGAQAETMELPPGLSARLEQLLGSIVYDSTTDGEKALAIEDFLRSSKFSYSLSAPSSIGAGAISNFLLTDRSGYCVHFATGMTVLARMAGIPARIAIGFAPGEANGDGSYEVTAHDAHAWPELYFDELGWVPFEPTPSYSGSEEESEEQESAAPTPTAAPETTEVEEPSAEPAQPEQAAPDASDGSGGLGWALLLVAALILAATPALVRLLQRRARLQPGAGDAAVEGAWAEVQATFADYGLAWPAGSPVPAAAAAGELLSPDGAAALGELALTVELARFARPGQDSPARLGELVGRVRRAARESATGRRSLLARFLPASTLGWRRG